MRQPTIPLVLIALLMLTMVVAGCGKSPAATQNAEGKQVTIEVFHADSLAGPMGQLKKAFEAKNPSVMINLTSGPSKLLAERIFKGDTCDVFAPSDPAVIKDMMAKKIGDKPAAVWSVTFSANEMVVIVKKGNPMAIKQMVDLAKDGVRVVRVTGEKDMATFRTLDFIKNATAAEGKADLGLKIIDGTAVKAGTIPEAVQALKDGKADAGVVYLSAAVAAGDAVEIVNFPAAVNLSELIRNAVTVPGTAKNAEVANGFIKFILSAEGQQILKKTGQPPIVPALHEGSVPQGLLP
ncbi:MAG: molybdate ABC transporter substrate-binding protein [Negativicutes bacterium]|nr:molybdate ABC transporter substrate-binding protein [Negativicutes bacterium]